MDPFQDVPSKEIESSLRFIAALEGHAKYKVASADQFLDGGKAETHTKDGSFLLAFHTRRVLSQDERHALWQSPVIFECWNESRRLVFDFLSFSKYSVPLLRDATRFDCVVRKYRTSGFHEKNESYYRAILPLEAAHRPRGLIESERVRVGSTVHMAGLVPITFNNKLFHLYPETIKQDNQQLLFIDSQESIGLGDFRVALETILISYAFVTGYYPREKRYILSAPDPSFTTIDDISFDTLSHSFSSTYSVVPSSALRLHFGIQEDIRFPIVSFERLCHKLATNSTLARVIVMLVEGHVLSIHLRAAVYSIALEAITDIISQENEARFVPIEDKSLAKKILDQLLTTLEEFKPQLSASGFETLTRKLRVLNSPTNKDKLLLPFSLLQIELSANEVKCIESRNDFLHGRFPFDYSNSSENYQLEQVALTLLFCVNALILKYIGYSGPIIYYPALNEYKEEKRFTESFLRRI